MQIYKVGGAVRDRLLGRPVTENDWVVVGASAEQMLELGYRPVSYTHLDVYKRQSPSCKASSATIRAFA